MNPTPAPAQVFYVRPDQIVPNPGNPRYITDAQFEKLVQSLIDFPEMLEHRALVCVTAEYSLNHPDTPQYMPLGGNMRSRAFPVALERLRSRISDKLPEEPGFLISNAKTRADGERLLAAIAILERGVPVTLADSWTPEQRREFVIKDNVAFGNWDWDIIANEWPEVEQWGLELPVFPEYVEPEADAAEDEYDGKVPVLPKTETGDVYELNGHRLICGSCLETGTIDALFEGRQVDLLFTDPPYGVSAGGGRTQTVKRDKIKKIENDELRGAAFQTFLEQALALVPLRDEGSFYICYDHKAQKENIQALESLNLTYNNTIIWNKNVFGLSGHKGYRPKHELIAFGYKGETYDWQGGNDQANVWDIPRPTDRPGNHPTPKPIEVPARGIKNSSKKGDRVADIFGGSGSTLMACEQLARTAYIAELEPGYCDYMVQRWTAYMKAQNKPYKITRNGVDITSEAWLYQ